MLQLGEATIKALSGEVDNGSGYVKQDVWPVDFVEIVISSQSITRLTNHFHDISTTSSVIGATGNHTFTAVSQLLGFGNISNDLEVKDNSLDISLSGVGTEATALVLANPVDGARIYIRRGFYNEELGVLVAPPYQRWAGRVYSYGIQDDYRFSDGEKIVISLKCKSLLLTLLERVTGRYTNQAGYQQYVDVYTTSITEDKSMEFIASLTNFAPEFGKGASTGGGGGGGGGKHLCTRYYELGDVPLVHLEADNFYQKAFITGEEYHGYSLWSRALAGRLEKGTFTYYLFRPFVKAWAQSMYWKITGDGKRSKFGEIVEFIGLPVCRWISRLLR